MIEEVDRVCCFCIGPLTWEEAAIIAVEPPGAREEVQTLWAHPTCLRQRVHPSVPMHPDLDPRDDGA